MSLVGSLRGVQANPEPCNSYSNRNTCAQTVYTGVRTVHCTHPVTVCRL